MSQEELAELIRKVGMGRRDAADTLAELLIPLLGNASPTVEPAKVIKKAVPK